MENKKSNWKIWRLTKVLYFIITLPLVLLWAWTILSSQETYNWGIWINDYYIWSLYMILFLISYILSTDFIRRVISYINNWTFNWFIPYIKILKRFFIIIILILWITLITLVSLSNNFKKTNNITPTNNFINELDYDIKNGATVDEILNAYPEVEWNIQLVNELIYDIKNGATIDEINNAYPELNWWEKQVKNK